MSLESLAYWITARGSNKAIQIGEIDPVSIAQDYVLQSYMCKLLVDVRSSAAEPNNSDLTALKNAL